MKYYMKTIGLLTAVSALVFCGSAVASPMISIDLGSNEAVEPADEAGVVAATNWNQAAGSPDFSDVALEYSDGTASGATVSGDFASNKTSPVGVTADPNTEMFNRGGTVNQSAGSDITVSGLATDGDWEIGYDVYVYFASRSDFTTTNDLDLTIGDTTYLVELSGGTANYTGTFESADATSTPRDTGKNYVKFTGVTGSTFTLNAFCAVNDRLLITGMQIVPIPKPERSVISVDLGPTGETVEASDIAGAYPAANWAVAAGNDLVNAALNYSDGSAASATISTDFSYNKTTTVGVSSDPNTEMYNRGGGIPNGDGASFTVDNLPADNEWAGGYDVYVYFAPVANSTTNDLDLTLGDTTCYTSVDTASSNYSGTFEPCSSTHAAARDSGKNVAKFTGITGASFTVSMLCNQQSRVAITGMQIVSGLIEDGGTPPETSAVLSLIAGTSTVTVIATNLTVGATHTLLGNSALTATNWLPIDPVVTGVSETNWVVATTNVMFFKVESE